MNRLCPAETRLKEGAHALDSDQTGGSVPLPRVGGALSARSRQYQGTVASMSNAPKLAQCRSRRSNSKTSVQVQGFSALRPREGRTYQAAGSGDGIPQHQDPGPEKSAVIPTRRVAYARASCDYAVARGHAAGLTGKPAGAQPARSLQRAVAGLDRT